MSRQGVEKPARPSVPLVLWMLFLTLVVERATLLSAFGGTWATRANTRWCAAAIAMLAVCGSAVAYKRHKERTATILASVIVAALAVVVASLAGLVQSRAALALSTSAVSQWELVTTSDCTESSFGYRCLAHICGSNGNNHIGNVWLSVSEPVPQGSRLRCVGRFTQLGHDEYGVSSWLQGSCGSVRAVRVMSREDSHGLRAELLRLREQAVSNIGANGSETRALLAGCVFGYRSALDSLGVTDEFATCGMAHLIAVSGMHLTLLTYMVAQALEAFDLGVRPRIVILVVVSGLYVLLCGAPVSAVRAWLMSLAAYGSILVSRRNHALSAVGVMGLAMALIEPHLCGQLGFLLSVLSVVSLCLFARYLTYVIEVMLPMPALPRWLAKARRTALRAYRSVVGSLAASVVCQVATLPLVAQSFGRVSLIGPISNVAVGPLFLPLMVLGGCGCFASFTSTSCMILLAPADLVGRAVLALMRVLERLPFASVAVPSFPVWLCICWLAALLGLLVWWPSIKREKLARVLACVGLVAVATLIRWRYLQPARIVVLDVGQGDAILVQDGPHAILVDAGPDDAVAHALFRNHVLHLDALLVTHLHDDHYGGMNSLKGGVHCDRMIVAKGVAGAMSPEIKESCQDLTGKEPVEIAYGDKLHVGHFELEMIWPHEEVDGSVNPHSIELLVTYCEHDKSLVALLTGDAERDETGACLDVGDVGDIDFLKVGHHGSEVSLTQEQALELRPEVSVASAGEHNEYGHPRRECVEMLECAGSVFLCTKDVGDVEVRPGGEGPAVSCARPKAKS